MTENLSLAEKTMLLMQDILSVREGIEAALAHAYDSYSFDDVVFKILSGECHFYKEDECFTIMQVITYPQYKTYHCFLASGTQEALDDIWEKMQVIAKALNCTYVTITGRPGWARRLKSRGWVHRYVTMAKEV